MSREAAPKRVYIDGIFDLFHVGHLRALKHAKAAYPDAELVVGVVGDDIAVAYKRKPTISEAERAELIEAYSFVHEVIVPSPLTITREYALEHKIDRIVHGFCNERDKTNFMKRHTDVMAWKPDIFEESPYTHSTSTSAIMRKCHDVVVAIDTAKASD